MLAIHVLVGKVLDDKDHPLPDLTILPLHVTGEEPGEAGKYLVFDIRTSERNSKDVLAFISTADFRKSSATGPPLRTARVTRPAPSQATFLPRKTALSVAASSFSDATFLLPMTALICVLADAYVGLPGWLRGGLSAGWVLLLIREVWAIRRARSAPVDLEAVASAVEEEFPRLAERLTTAVELAEQLVGFRERIGQLPRRGRAG